MKKLLVLIYALISLASCSEVEKKNILIIYSRSSHANYCHNNTEVAELLKRSIEASQYNEQLHVDTVFNYPTDLSLVENADLIIISSDGGPHHALVDKKDLTKHTRHLDSVLKKNKTGLIMVHWATDAPSGKFATLHPVNGQLMMDWIGAVYYWDKPTDGRKPNSSWTWKYPVMDIKVNKSHPISKGLPDTFKLQDEYYFNFFTDGADSRNPGSDRVTFLHTTMAPTHAVQQRDPSTFREQSCYWAFDRADEGRSVAFTSAHMYHTWANPHFFKTFTNSIFWTLNLPIPENGVEISTPTIEDLLSINTVAQIHTKALHFK